MAAGAVVCWAGEQGLLGEQGVLEVGDCVLMFVFIGRLNERL